MMVVAKFKNRTHLSKFVKKDLALPYVDRTNIRVVLISVKEDLILLNEKFIQCKLSTEPAR